MKLHCTVCTTLLQKSPAVHTYNTTKTALHTVHCTVPTHQVKLPHLEDLLLTLADIVLCNRLNVNCDSEHYMGSAGVRVEQRFCRAPLLHRTLHYLINLVFVHDLYLFQSLDNH